MVLENLPLYQASSFKNPFQDRFYQILGESPYFEALLRMQEYRKWIWIQKEWNLYAPRLWNEAKHRQIHLVGVECSQKKKLRLLFKELKDSQFFDGWVLDHLGLQAAEGLFLHKLLRNSPQPSRILILENWPLFFCPQKVRPQRRNLYVRGQ